MFSAFFVIMIVPLVIVSICFLNNTVILNPVNVSVKTLKQTAYGQDVLSRPNIL